MEDIIRYATLIKEASELRRLILDGTPCDRSAILKRVGMLEKDAEQLRTTLGFDKMTNPSYNFGAFSFAPGDELDVADPSETKRLCDLWEGQFFENPSKESALRFEIAMSVGA